MPSRLARVVGALMLSVSGVVLGLLIWQFFAVDSCLDSGGSFDYLWHQCDRAVSHPYPGFWRATGLPLLGAVVAGAIGRWLTRRGTHNAMPS